MLAVSTSFDHDSGCFFEVSRFTNVLTVVREMMLCLKTLMTPPDEQIWRERETYPGAPSISGATMMVGTESESTICQYEQLDTFMIPRSCDGEDSLLVSGQTLLFVPKLASHWGWRPASEMRSVLESFKNCLNTGKPQERSQTEGTVG